MKLELKPGLLIVLILLVVSVLQPDEVIGKQTKIWRGYLIDSQCMKAVATSSDPLDFVFHHTKDCVLMPSCIKGGFSLYLPRQKKSIQLDSKGNKLAERAIRASKLNSAFWVLIEGKIVDGVIKVKSLKEIEKKNKSMSLK